MQQGLYGSVCVFGVSEWQLGSSSCCASSRQLAVISSVSSLGVLGHFHTLALHRISLITTSQSHMHAGTHSCTHAEFYLETKVMA